MKAVESSYHVLQVDEGVVDGHNLHLLGVEGGTSHQTTDAAKSKKNKTKRRFSTWPLDVSKTPGSSE